jgi:predicted HAD superfamily Cof-like phosphohydrolase
MDVMGQEVLDTPTIPSEKITDLRYELIREELEELLTAINNNDIISIADGLTDLLYVVYGAGHAFGLDLDACFIHIHESNMSKLDVDGNAIKREDGKVLKGPYYWAPDLESILY